MDINRQRKSCGCVPRELLDSFDVSTIGDQSRSACGVQIHLSISGVGSNHHLLFSQTFPTNLTGFDDPVPRNLFERDAPEGGAGIEALRDVSFRPDLRPNFSRLLRRERIWLDRDSIGAEDIELRFARSHFHMIQSP